MNYKKPVSRKGAKSAKVFMLVIPIPSLVVLTPSLVIPGHRLSS